MNHIIIEGKALCRSKELVDWDPEPFCDDCLYIIEVEELVEQRKAEIALERIALRKGLEAQNPLP